jgi:hypothetical protein
MAAAAIEAAVQILAARDSKPLLLNWILRLRYVCERHIRNHLRHESVCICKKKKRPLRHYLYFCTSRAGNLRTPQSESSAAPSVGMHRQRPLVSILLLYQKASKLPGCNHLRQESV